MTNGIRQLLRHQDLSSHVRSMKFMLQQAGAIIAPRTAQHPHRFVLVAGVPKSGTTWMENLVEAIPGYKRLVPYDPDNLLFDHVLDPRLLERLPRRGNYFLKTHVEARPEGVAALRRHRVPTVVMVRDLRDQCVSRFYHVLNSPAHRHHALYTNSERATAFSHCVEISVTEYAEWVRGWVRESANDQLFLLVRYEDMLANIGEQFRRVLRHFDIALRDEELDRLVRLVRERSEKSGEGLNARLKTGTNTLRAGRIGDWRNHFTPTDVARFKAMAADTLVSLGYEHDNEWQLLQPGHA